MTPGPIKGDEPNAIAPEREEENGKLEIVVARPPIWAEAHKHFTLDDQRTVYTYASKLYNPGNQPIDEALLSHETVHAGQQWDLGMELPHEGLSEKQIHEQGAAEWWRRYFADKAFRLAQELEAYQYQYRYFCHVQHDRNRQARFLVVIAGDLAGPTYGAGISQVEAMQKIKRGTL